MSFRPDEMTAFHGKGRHPHSPFVAQCANVAGNHGHYPVPRACFHPSLGARSILLVSAVQTSCVMSASGLVA